MIYELDLDLLRRKLSRAKRQKEKIPVSETESDGELSEGVKYLIKNVLTPLFSEERVHSADLDFSQFDDRDIEALYDYYMEHYYNGDSDWHTLRNIYRQCAKADALIMPVHFI